MEELMGLKVVYLKMNRAYAVVFGRDIVPIGMGRQLLFRSYTDLTEALRQEGLGVYDDTGWIYLL